MKPSSEQKQFARGIVQRLQTDGFTALFAGGCVRDELLGREPKDYDVATNATPDEVEARFPRTLAIGKAFGVIAVINDRSHVEVATFRGERGTHDGRHPAAIHFCEAAEDAKRRDFTINGLFYDPFTDRIDDHVNGRRDLEARIVRAIGNPIARFEEDHLRMLRAVRFAHTLDFTIDPATADAIRHTAPRITRISAERIENELTRILTESLHPGDAIRQLHSLGLLHPILPELAATVGQQQPPQFHPEGDVFEHTLLMLNLMNTPPEPTAPRASANYTPRELAYAVLLHDIGKPPTARTGLDKMGHPRIRFNGHASVGADLADAILARLKFPTKERRRIVEAIRGHMRFMEVPNMRPATLRRMIGADTFALELELNRLDCLGSHGLLDNHDFLVRFRASLENEPALPEPWIRGNDLLALGVAEGRRIGTLLKVAYDTQMEGRFTDRAALLEWLKKTYGKH